MDDLYLVIRDDILTAWNAGWTRTDVPVFWRSNQPLPDPDPLGGSGHEASAHFLRNEVDFGHEDIVGFGGGRHRNLRAQYGSVLLRTFSSLVVQDEDESLKLMSAAMAIFRSYRVTDSKGGDLSFIGTGSGFDSGPTEDGVWFMRGALAVFEYRFPG